MISELFQGTAALIQHESASARIRALKHSHRNVKVCDSCEACREPVPSDSGSYRTAVVKVSDW